MNRAVNGPQLSERKASLRSYIVPLISRAMGSKRRQLKISVPYMGKIDAVVFGLNAANGFQEVYTPETFRFLDSVLGNGWDYKRHANSGRYAFACQVNVRLNLNRQQLEIIGYFRDSSSFEWRMEYREDIVKEICNALPSITMQDQSAVC